MRSGLQLQKAILVTLSDGECSLRELETRVNTNYNTIRAHCKMLEFYGLLELMQHGKSDANGRPYTTARLTDRGKDVLKERRVAP